MRKQTKLVAVLSTAALLAIGASMTSFAATGWVEEDGTWVYYNRDEERATEEWKKSGDNWFWLDDNGEMAVDQLIEDDDDYYYVNEAGAMVSNQWVAIENEDAGEEDEPDYYWYYFQANGKAYTRPDSADEDSISARTINGRRYAFDEEGRMLYGWVQGGERQTDDDAWREADYYLGDENDGAISQGWVQISITDDQYEDDLQPGDEYWDEDQDRWFYFLTSGKKVKADSTADNDLKQRTISGRRYGFDGYGRMVASWYKEGTISDAEATQNDAAYSSEFMYFSDPEDGARMTRGWFKVVPGYYLEEDEYSDGSDYWYYADGSGKLYANEIRSINGRRYAFNQNGRMLDGLVLLQMKYRNTSDAGEMRFESTDIETVLDSDGSLPYDTEDNFNDTVNGEHDTGSSDEITLRSESVAQALSNGELRFYYFGDSEDGSMKTGRQTVEIDGEDFTFKFRDSSSSRGASIHGMDDHKLYNGGKMFRADSDDRYRAVVYVEYTDGTITMEDMDVDDFLDTYTDGGRDTEDGDETVWSVLPGAVVEDGKQ